MSTEIEDAGQMPRDVACWLAAKRSGSDAALQSDDAAKR